MKKTILATAVALTCFVGSIAASSQQPEGDTLYDRAVNQLAIDARPEAKEEAIATLYEAMEQGDGRAALKLGQMALHFGNRDGDAAYLKGIAHIEQAVVLNTPGAAEALAVAMASRGYYVGRDTPEGRAIFAQALPRLVEAAARPDPSPLVLWHLGIMQVTGLAGGAELAAGHANITRAAEAGNGQAAMFMANRYRGMIPSQLEGELQYLKIASNAGVRQARDRIAEHEARWASNATPGTAMGGITVESATSAMFEMVPASNAVPAAAATSGSVSNVSAAASGEVLTLKSQLDTTTRELAAIRALLADAERRAGNLRTVDLIALNNDGLKSVLEGDYETAVLKFREASKHDYAPALANMGLMYLNGTGVVADGRQAIALFARAAKQGNLVAAENIARAYDFGLGINQDRSRAIQWYEKAMAMGSSTAPAALDRLKSS